MKRKEAIKQIQEGKIQVFNDLLPSTKEIKKFLKEAFPEDKYIIEENSINFYDKKYFYASVVNVGRWCSSNARKDLPIINLSTITKRKKTKLIQLEKQFSDLAKDVVDLNKNVSELRQTLAKDVEVDVEEVKSELIVGEWYDFFNSDYDKEIYIQETIKEEEIDFSVQDLFIYEKGTYIVCSNGKQNLDENTFEGKVIYSTGTHQYINLFSKNWSKRAFKPFKGELTIK